MTGLSHMTSPQENYNELMINNLEFEQHIEFKGSHLNQVMKNGDCILKL